VAVIGHFPFVTALRKVCDTCWVLEKRPQPGDVEASEAPNILPQADVVALTGTTLLTAPWPTLLNLCRADATVVMVGPTTPYAPSLFTCGIDILAGCDVVDPNQALDGILGGKCFKGLEAPARPPGHGPGWRSRCRGKGKEGERNASGSQEGPRAPPGPPLRGIKKKLLRE